MPQYVGPLGAFERVAEPGADGVHHDDVGDVEQRVGVVLERIGRWTLRPDLGSHHPPRAHDAHVQPERSGARPPVVGEDERPLRGGRAVRAEVPGIEEFRGGFAVFASQGGARHHRVVLDGLVAHDDRVAALPARRFRVCRCVLLSGSSRGEKQQGCQQKGFLRHLVGPPKEQGKQGRASIRDDPGCRECCLSLVHSSCGNRPRKSKRGTARCRAVPP